MDAMERFLAEHGSVVLNALENQSRRMSEAATLAETDGAPGYARLFREQADNAESAVKALSRLVRKVRS